MKQSRRHELKTNELSVFLQKTYTSARENANYLIGGLVAVVAVLVIILYVQHKRTQTREQAWNEYNSLMQQSVTEKPELLDKVRGFAANERGNGELGFRAAALAADTAYELAMSLSPITERDRRLTLLRDARDRYLNVIQENPSESAGVARARLSLAFVEESLLAAGESTPEKAKAQYETLIKDKQVLYSELASNLLQTFDERTAPLRLVATRPAEVPETAPSTRPTTRPTTQAAERAPSTPATTRAATTRP